MLIQVVRSLKLQAQPALMAQGGPGPPGDGPSKSSQIKDASFVRARTEDVLGDKNFSDLGLPQPMIAALARCGFERPSPVQQAAIPLGRLGSDLIVQAKSGTGKTVVFATIILERLNLSKPVTQVSISGTATKMAAAVTTALSDALLLMFGAGCRLWS
jgi:ATP-dependent RNA helicase DDX20